MHSPFFTTMSGSLSLSERVRCFARELGFDLTGIARAEPLTREGDYLDTWLRAQMHGDMSYLARNPQRRIDPSLVLPGCRSVIVVAMNYFHPHYRVENPQGAKISRYAWGNDYHTVLGTRLRRLEQFISSMDTRSQCRSFVDAGPVLEKAWAVRAGIGWMGKHTLLVSPDYGSWIFLGVVLTTAELDPDVPETDRCGDCTRCLNACPTGAISHPYRLDARACIAYRTIAWKGENTVGLDKEDYGNWVFGCDICQETCPWNTDTVPSLHPEFAPRASVLSTTLEELAQLDEKEFRARFKGTPIARAGFRILKRNTRLILRQRSMKTQDPPAQNKAGNKIWNTGQSSSSGQVQPV
ncbi:MAG: tRNA epoxyqueuosine(34) reductase QueG [Bacteroidota bacterium]|nr:tRNA epoxyqueuosine(34) reductase QueG [Bacteroidota bacterium]